MTKYALITGASSSIGYSLAAEFSKHGYKVYGGAPEHTLKDMEPLEKLGVVPFALDITDIKLIEKAVEFFQESTGGDKLDVLYNNAGFGYRGAGCEFANDDLMQFYNTSLMGHIFVTKYFADFVVNAKGVIAYTTSIGARLPVPWLSHYCASQAGLDTYAKGIRSELEPLGVSVYSVLSGGVKTNITENSTNSASNRVDWARYNTPKVKESIQVLSDAADKGMDTKLYAEKVVSKILARFSGFNIYEGKDAGSARIFSWLPLLWQYAMLQKQYKLKAAFEEFRELRE